MLTADTRYGTFYYFDSDSIGQRIAKGEFHDAFLKPYLDRLQPGDVFVDVGANIGFLSVYASKHGATVHAFEPSREVAHLLMKNSIVNNCPIHLMVRALYDQKCRLGINKKWMPVGREDELDYNQMPNSGGLSLVREKDGEFYAEALDQYNLPRLTLLKIDTQGSDLRVLVGAYETIKICRPTILFEFEDGGRGRNAAGDSLDDFEAFLGNLGYGIMQLNAGEFGSDWVAEPIP